jgi:hypothetical protein
MLFLSWELRDSNRAADRPRSSAWKRTPRGQMLNLDLKQKKHRLLDTFSWELRDSNRAADRPRSSAWKRTPRGQMLNLDLKQKKHRFLSAFSSVGVEGFEPPTLCL